MVFRMLSVAGIILWGVRSSLILLPDLLIYLNIVLMWWSVFFVFNNLGLYKR